MGGFISTIYDFFSTKKKYVNVRIRFCWKNYYTIST